MGLLTDSNGNIQQLVSVNSSGTNVTRYGTSGSGQPAWNSSLAGHTTDNTVTWENRGPVGLWAPSTLFSNFGVGGTLANPCIIYDPATDALYGNTNPSFASGTSGTTRPKFTGVNGSKVSDNSGGGGITWVCIKTKPGVWQPSHAYPLWSSNFVAGEIVEPIALSATYHMADCICWRNIGKRRHQSGLGNIAWLSSDRRRPNLGVPRNCHTRDLDCV